MKKRKLSNGSDYGYDAHGRRICRGAKMGRCNKLPEDCDAPIKLHLVKLKWVDGGYDEGGAYWGNSPVGPPWEDPPEHIFWAYGEKRHAQVEVFVRATSRYHARNAVVDLLPNARFYR